MPAALHLPYQPATTHAEPFCSELRRAFACEGGKASLLKKILQTRVIRICANALMAGISAGCLPLFTWENHRFCRWTEMV